MSIRLLLSSAVLIAAAASAGSGQKVSPSKAAEAFTLDSVSPGATATPDASATPGPAVTPTVAAPAIPENAALATPASPAMRAVFTLDTPIQDLLADPGAKAVLDKDLPGMSDDENLDKFKMLGLRALQPQTGGQLTDAMLAKVASDLDVLGGGTGSAVMTAPVKAGNPRRNRDTSR